MGIIRSAVAAYRNGAFIQGEKHRTCHLFYKGLFGDVIEISGQLMETSAHWPRQRSHLPSMWHEEPAFSRVIERSPIFTAETLRNPYDCFDTYGFEIDCAPVGCSFDHDPDEVENELHQVYARR